VTAGWAPVVLVRDCAATTIPFGERVTLDAGVEVQIVQQLGAAITVRTERGALLRVDGTDADALGLERPAEGDTAMSNAPFDMDQVIDALRGIYDPEIPVSIVELGLVYRCEEVDGADGARRIEIDMSMTAPGCGMGDVLRADATRAVQAVPGVGDVEVTLVWDPPWSIHRMSEEARLELGLL
jgi:probable FeS assembly SUF system protein SufT